MKKKKKWLRTGKKTPTVGDTVSKGISWNCNNLVESGWGEGVGSNQDLHLRDDEENDEGRPCLYLRGGREGTAMSRPTEIRVGGRGVRR